MVSQERQKKAEEAWISLCAHISCVYRECTECHMCTLSTPCSYCNEFSEEQDVFLCAYCLPPHYTLHQLQGDEETLTGFYQDDLKWAKQYEKFQNVKYKHPSGT
jgi:hypothetical protein